MHPTDIHLEFDSKLETPVKKIQDTGRLAALNELFCSKPGRRDETNAQWCVGGGGDKGEGQGEGVFLLQHEWGFSLDVVFWYSKNEKK